MTLNIEELRRGLQALTNSGASGAPGAVFSTYADFTVHGGPAAFANQVVVIGGQIGYCDGVNFLSIPLKQGTNYAGTTPATASVVGTNSIQQEVGNNAFCFGTNSFATGSGSLSFGGYAINSFSFSFGSYAVSAGQGTLAIGPSSVAAGISSVANGNGPMAGTAVYVQAGVGGSSGNWSFTISGQDLRKHLPGNGGAIYVMGAVTGKLYSLTVNTVTFTTNTVITSLTAIAIDPADAAGSVFIMVNPGSNGWMTALGRQSLSRVSGQAAYGTSPHTVNGISIGTCQHTMTTLRAATTNATATAMTADYTTTQPTRNSTGTGPVAGTGVYFSCLVDHAYSFTVEVIGKVIGTGAVIRKTITGVVANNNGTTSILASTANPYTTDYADATLSTAAVAVAADNANSTLNVNVTGVAATNINWTARIVAVEVGA